MTLYKKNNSVSNKFITKTIFQACFVMLLLMGFTNARAQKLETLFGVMEPAVVAPGATVQVPVAVKDVEGLYAVDFSLEYDPTIVQLVDADAIQPGIQAGLGTFLDPGLLVFNTADNQKGEYRFVMSQYNPSLPKSGEGNIVVLTFKGISTGESNIHFTGVELLSGEITAIQAKVLDSNIQVISGAATQAATIAVAQATGLIILPKDTPTPTVTATTIPTRTPEPQPSPGGENQAGNGDGGSTATGGSEPGRPATAGKGSGLANGWPLIAVFIVLLAGGVTFMLKKKTRKKVEENHE